MNIKLAALFVIFFYLNRDLFEAVFYPIHSSTFGIFAVFLLSYAILYFKWEDRLSKREWLYIFGTYFFLTLFKQTFSVMGVGLALAILTFTSQRKVGALFLVFTIFMSWFTVSGRELLIGPIIQHTNRVPFDLSAVLTKYKFNWGEFSSLVKFIFYLSPVLLLAYQSRNKWSSSDKKKIILITGFFFPYLLGQFLSGSYWRHYNTVLIAYIGVLILLLVKPYTLTAKRLQLCFIFFICVGISKIKKPILITQDFNFKPMCVHNDEALKNLPLRKNKLQSAIDIIKAESEGSNPKIIGRNGVLVNLYSEVKDAEVFQYFNSVGTKSQMLLASIGLL